MKNRRNKKDDNFLDCVPVCVDRYTWDKDEAGAVTIYIENKGFFNRAAQKLLHKPKVSQVHLEKMGSFIWPLIDGEKTVYEIGRFVSDEFGEEAEPLYPRLTQYFRMLMNCGFVEMKKH